MQFERVEVAGLLDVRGVLATSDPKASYLILKKKRGAGWTSVGKRSLSLSDLGDFLGDDAPSFDSRELDFHGSSAFGAYTAQQWEALLDAAMRWIAESVERQCDASGDPTVFEVEARGPRGENVVVKAKVTARLSDGPPADASTGARELKEAETGALQGVLDMTIRTSQQLVDHASSASARLVKTMELDHGVREKVFNAQQKAHEAALASQQRIIDTQEKQLDAAHKKLTEAHKRLEDMAGEFLTMKIGVAELGINQTQSKEALAVQQEMGTRFIDTLGKTAEAYFASQGMDPRLLELVRVIESDQPLKEALLNPRVLAMLRLPAMREVLRLTLLGAAEDAAKDAAKPEQPGA